MKKRFLLVVGFLISLVSCANLLYSGQPTPSGNSTIGEGTTGASRTQ